MPNANLDNQLQQKDINYIKKEMGRIEQVLAEGFKAITTQISSLREEHVTQREFEREINEIKKRINEVKEELKNKVDREEFNPIKKILSRINWLVLSSIILALLGLVIVKVA